MTYDLIQRRLEDSGHTVKMVRNITDVDEPIYVRAAQLGIDYRELASQEQSRFEKVMQAMNFRPLYAQPKASEYIYQMAEAVKGLLDKSIAYRLENDIYFDVSQDQQFGHLSQLPDELALKILQKRGGDPHREGKKTPLDFLLWKGITDLHDPAAWDTDLGHGRPGWHIECSVMSSALLGTPFDLHGGGNDLIFPHHECEIAQTRAISNQELAKHWVHVAPIIYLGEKMSKSLGNMVFADELLKHYSPATIRLALMHYDYREGGEWLPEFLEESSQFLIRLDERFDNASPEAATRLLESLRSALDDDLDTHTINHLLQDFCANPDNASRSPEETSQSAATIRKCRNLLGI